jgi:glycosyltransferase involved in cell wall biosynthesis
VRDAIVLSQWSWETFNVPERISLALRQLGARVLHCEHPVSIFRGARPVVREVEPGIHAFLPIFFSQRMTHVPLLHQYQAHYIADQILEQAEKLGLQAPLFIYHWMGRLLPLCKKMKGKFPMVHVQMDYGEPDANDHIALSDLTLVIQRSVYHQQRARYGDKIRIIPQVVDLRHFQPDGIERIRVSPEMSSIPGPRLGYLGPAHAQVNRELLFELLQKHPEWHFVSIGNEKTLPLPNAHVVPWQPNSKLPEYAAGFDVGLMPYNCHLEQKLHCTPLKLFEYFALGLPVVSAPLIELWQYEQEIYFGNSAEEMARAVVAALEEPPDSPKKLRRIMIARQHSVENLAATLKEALSFPNA